MDINTLIAALQGATNVNLNITITQTEPVDEPQLPETDSLSSSYLPDTDFEEGDRVLVCHTRKDGTGTKHTLGTVIEVLQKDENGWYTRVAGDNGKHYRIGLKYDEERLGSKAIVLDDEGDE